MAKNKIEDVETPKVPEQMVQVKKEDLEKLLQRVESQAKDIDLLYKASDKSRLSKAMGPEEHLIKSAKVAKWPDNDKYVIGWRLSKNTCEIINGRWVEDQQTTVVFDDGENVTVPLLEFYRKMINKDSGDIIARTNKLDEKGVAVEILTIQFPNGRELSIGSQYIN